MRKTSSYLAASALSGLLVFFLLWTATSAVTPSHQREHAAGNSSADHLCVLCVYAHGQLIAADAAPLTTQDFAGYTPGMLPPDLPAPAAADCALPQGRAPPPIFA